jgi:hypothetical protein
MTRVCWQMCEVGNIIFFDHDIVFPIALTCECVNAVSIVRSAFIDFDLIPEIARFSDKICSGIANLANPKIAPKTFSKWQ